MESGGSMRRLRINTRSLNEPTTGVQRVAHEVMARLGIAWLPLQTKPQHRLVNPAFEMVAAAAPSLRKDVLWSPCNVGPANHPRHVVTVHDVATLHHPEWYSKSFAAYYRLLLPRLVRHAATIITVSEFTKSEILELGLRSRPEDIVVIRNGHTPVPSVAASDTPDRPFVLSVGTLQPRKNLANAVRGFLRAADDQALPHELLVVGGAEGHLGDAELPRDPRVRYLGRVSDDELSRLYATASAMIYIPLYEGFGLPPVEAAGHGCPLVLSSIGPLTELFGTEQVAWVESLDSLEEIAAALVAALELPHEALTVVPSWDDVAADYREAFCALGVG